MMNALDSSRIPQHIAIIMDGNGRWAKARGLDRSMGHQEGAARVRDITEAASNLGVKFLTLYTFSTENWNRPAPEVSALMALIIESLEEELFMKNNVRLRIIGERDRLPDFVKEGLDRCVRNTAGNTGMTMVLALCAHWCSRRRQEHCSPRLSTRRASVGRSPRPSCPTPNSSSAPGENSA